MKAQLYACRMGWAFRKSFNLGPLRINASKSGIGYSVGGRGFRVGKDARGRNYRSISIPGTGIYNRTYSAKSRNAATYGPASSASSTPKPSLVPNAGKILAYLGGAAAIYLVIYAVVHAL
jgi:uncharacterized protein DUF4236